MKTPEEWAEDREWTAFWEVESNEIARFVKAVQENAWQQGMKDAAELAKNTVPWTHDSCEHAAADSIVEAITNEIQTRAGSNKEG